MLRMSVYSAGFGFGVGTKSMQVDSMPTKRTLSYTMRDVARLAGVSVTTVSSVVNARAGVSPKLTGRVEDAIAALDYHPNAVARSLKVNRTFTLGMIVPDVSNFFSTTSLREWNPRPANTAIRSSCATPTKTPRRSEICF